MQNKPAKILFVLTLFGIQVSPAYADDSGLRTLFTTPQERAIIDGNRYRVDEKPEVAEPQQQPAPVKQAEPELVLIEVIYSFRISGISINNDGSRTAWINDQAYIDGELLEQGIKLRINDGAVKTVSLLAPDGKSYRAASGETLEVPLMQAGDEG